MAYWHPRKQTIHYRYLFIERMYMIPNLLWETDKNQIIAKNVITYPLFEIQNVFINTRPILTNNFINERTEWELKFIIEHKWIACSSCFGARWRMPPEIRFALSANICCYLYFRYCWPLVAQLPAHCLWHDGQFLFATAALLLLPRWLSHTHMHLHMSCGCVNVSGSGSKQHT